MPFVVSTHLLYSSAWLLYLGAGVWGLRYLARQSRRSYRTMQVCLVAGLALHTAWLAWRGLHGASWIPGTLHELIIGISWALVLVGVALGLRLKAEMLWIVWAWAASVLVGIGGALAHGHGAAHPHWYGLGLSLHSSSLVLSYAALLVACASGLVYLIEERRIKQKRLVKLYPWLPSLDGLDEIQGRALFIGFCLMTLGLAMGLVTAQRAWGSFWRWDAKEVWSVGMWATYAVALWLRWHSAWRGRKLAWFSVAGFGVVMFTCLGVNYLLPTQHVFF